MSLTDLSKATGLYKSTLLRLLTSLERANLVMRRTDRRYTLGSFAFLLGRGFEYSNGFRETLLPIFEWLVDQGTESPSFHILHGSESRLCLYRLDSKHSTLDHVRAGNILPLNRGAAGKVLLTFANPVAITPSTLVFTSFGERDPHCGAVAAPVFGPNKMLLGSLSLSGPLERFAPKEVDRMSALLLKACKNSTIALGGSWP